MDRVVAIAQEHEKGTIDHHKHDRQIAQLTGLTEGQVAAVSTAWIGPPFSGVSELIERVLERGFKTACLSNTNDRHWQQMNDLPEMALDRLHYRFASQEIGAVKPDATIYRHVETVTGIAPKAILYFDDHLPNIVAASNCGWKAHQVVPGQDPVAQMNQHLVAQSCIEPW